MTKTTMTTKTEKLQSTGQPDCADPAKDMLLGNTVQVLRALMECSDEIRDGVMEMAAILADPNTDEDEKAAAGDTLIEALYPQYFGPDLGVDSAAYEEMHRKDVEPETEAALDEEESVFAANLQTIMARRNLTQTQLAEMIGVGQSAIANMLSRGCRPQRRTVEKLAKALGVQPSELWPTPKPK